jgi:hypothetical protein
MDSFLLHKSGNQKMKVKTCFVIDATGSMGPWIEAAKTQTINVVNDLRNKHSEIEFEVAAVFYRDFGDNEQLKVVDFTSNTVDFTGDINIVKAYGGNDCCEDVAGGLKAAVDLNWDDADVKNLFLITDAPPHGSGWHSVTVSDNYPNNDFDIESSLRRISEKDMNFTIIKASDKIDMMIVRISAICKNLVVADLVSRNDIFEPTLRFPSMRYSDDAGGSIMSPEELTFTRSVTSQVEDSIRRSQSEH